MGRDDGRLTAAANEITSQIIGAAIEVHRVLGPGLLESAYEECLAHELAQRGVRFARQLAVPVEYKGCTIDLGFQLDFLVADQVVVELKSVDELLPVHVAQVLTYLKFAGLTLGLLINFNEKLLRDGIKRVVRGELGEIPFPGPKRPPRRETTED